MIPSDVYFPTTDGKALDSLDKHWAIQISQKFFIRVAQISYVNVKPVLIQSSRQWRHSVLRELTFNVIIVVLLSFIGLF